MSRVRPYSYRVWYRNLDGPETERELVAGENFRFGFQAPGAFFLGDLPPRLVDLLRVVMGIYVVDRLVRRGRNWPRSLGVRFEVLDLDFWSSSEVLDALRDTAEFVSGDSWDFEFVKNPRSYEGTGPLLTGAFAAESPLVCLFSGGLDSAAGLALRVPDRLDRLVIPVTVRHQPRQETLIKSQLDVLRNCRGVKIDSLMILARLIRPAGSNWKKSWKEEERSQRARAMLFTAAGAVAATLSGASDVEVYESGVGAINVPLMAGMLGSTATRGCHPEFLRRMSGLASLAARREIVFRLPFFEKTKGEMVRALARAGLDGLARETVSCARYPLGAEFYKPCGVCPACVFRRQAMATAGIEERGDAYTTDLFGDAQKVNLIPSKRLDALKAFLMLAAKLDEIDTTGRLPESVDRHLRDTRVLKPGESPEPIIRLLVRYRDEWRRVAEQGFQRGYRWARLLVPAGVVGQEVAHAVA